jgi:hypothetical protein
MVEFDEFVVIEPYSEMLSGRIPEVGNREGLLLVEVLFCAG